MKPYRTTQNILRVIDAAKPGVNPTVWSVAVLAIRPSQFQAICDDLSYQGLITVKKDPYGLIVDITLTEQGRQVLTRPPVTLDDPICDEFLEAVWNKPKPANLQDWVTRLTGMSQHAFHTSLQHTLNAGYIAYDPDTADEFMLTDAGLHRLACLKENS